jgi:hypothetical protein
LIISKVLEVLVEEMVNQDLRILIKHINKINVDRCLYQSLHHDIVVDDNHRLNEVI